MDQRASEQIHYYINRRLKNSFAVHDSEKIGSNQKMTTNPSTLNDKKTKQLYSSAPEKAVQPNIDSSSPDQKLLYIYYSTDEQRIPPEANAIIASVTKYMLENPARRIRIRGYTDSIGDPEYNMIVSQNRAYAIKYHLISKGIQAERISAIGFGARNFNASNKTAKLRALNRRVELELY